MMEEFNIIELIAKLSPNSRQWLGDDCAFDKVKNLLLSTDAMVEGIHFLGEVPPHSLGWKIAAVNFSDIAAMGGCLDHFLLSASLPERYTSSYWLEEFIAGVNDCCVEYGAHWSGGDLTASTKLYLCGTVIGHCAHNKVARRNTARVGDTILCAGYFGLSAAGLAILLSGLESHTRILYKELIDAHRYPKPLLTEAQTLVHNDRNRPVTMMDSSDGLLDCLEQLSQQSNVKFQVDASKIKISPILQKYMAARVEASHSIWDLIFVGGEDYALVATTTADYDADVWYPIGVVTNGSGVDIYGEGIEQRLATMRKFQHFTA